jgi:hypothetical protein
MRCAVCVCWIHTYIHTTSSTSIYRRYHLYPTHLTLLTYLHPSIHINQPASQPAHPPTLPSIPPTHKQYHQHLLTKRKEQNRTESKKETIYIHTYIHTLHASTTHHKPKRACSDLRPNIPVSNQHSILHKLRIATPCVPRAGRMWPLYLLTYIFLYLPYNIDQNLPSFFIIKKGITRR